MESNESDRLAWEQGLSTEVAFWHRWLTDAVIPWQDERRSRLDPTTPLQDWVRALIDTPSGSTVQLLDVGAGPATKLGYVWPGHELRITAVDPLAHEYDRILAECNIVPPVRTQFCHGERLTELFTRNTYDLACAFNALDHSYEPLQVIRQMIEVIKPGAWIVLKHAINEAEYERYEGLHQWNFSLENEKFVIWNRSHHISVIDHLSQVSDIRTIVTDIRSVNDGLMVFIRKQAEQALGTHESPEEEQSIGWERVVNGIEEEAIDTLHRGVARLGDELNRLGRFSADQAELIGRQQEALEQQTAQIAELRAWGADQAELIGRQQEALEQQTAQIAKLKKK